MPGRRYTRGGGWGRGGFSRAGASAPVLFCVKRRIILHVDVMRLLGRLRLDEAYRAEFERSGVVKQLLTNAYDADELVSALYESAYKVEEG